jgi:hypothetical protein
MVFKLSCRSAFRSLKIKSLLGALVWNLNYCERAAHEMRYLRSRFCAFRSLISARDTQMCMRMDVEKRNRSDLLRRAAINMTFYALK